MTPFFPKEKRLCTTEKTAILANCYKMGLTLLLIFFNKNFMVVLSGFFISEA